MRLQQEPARELRFTVGMAHVYARLKSAQLLVPARRLDEERRQQRWDEIHASIGTELHDLCAGLGGFHVKVGQFFSGRPDLVPLQWCVALSRLCDAVSPMAGEEARLIAERELGRSMLVDWVDAPLGSASVAQVHAARLAPPSPRRWWWPTPRRGRAVAVKVRRPEVAARFPRDLRAVRLASAFVQRFELDFDLVSGIDELADRVRLELDFRNEHASLVRVGSTLRGATRGAVAAPAAIAGTESCLVTELIDGQPLSSLARSAGPGSARLASVFGQRFVRSIWSAYGRMLLLTPSFHADPHPVRPQPTTTLPVRCRLPTSSCIAHALAPLVSPPRKLRRATSCCRAAAARSSRSRARSRHVVCAASCHARRRACGWWTGGSAAGRPPARGVASSPRSSSHLPSRMAAPAAPLCTAAGEARVADALRKLGVVKGGEPNDATEAWTARGMFDSRGELVVETRSQQAANVRAGAASAAQGSVEALPKDLFLVLRVTQMLRGLGAAAEVAGAPPAGSIAETWRPFALRALREAEEV